MDIVLSMLKIGESVVIVCAVLLGLLLVSWMVRGAIRIATWDPWEWLRYRHARKTYSKPPFRAQPKP
jgi:hypothetical protein